MKPEYREEPCRTALNKVTGMPFNWSLNPYMGCAHRCTFCYVRAFERRADRPADDRYGTSIRVKINVADVLDRELSRRTWRREVVAIGAATDPYQPAEGHYRLTRACVERLAAHRTPFHLITRGPMAVRDVDVLTEAAGRASVSLTFSIPTLDHDIWRRTEIGTAPPKQRLRALRTLVEAGLDVGVGMAPILPGLSDKPELMADVVRAARDAGATGVWANLLYLRRAPGSTSWTTWPATGRSCCDATSGSTQAGHTWAGRWRSRSADACATWFASMGSATGGLCGSSLPRRTSSLASR
ncbi:MAG: radical SAM protein [Chloroflexota bacterium]|nr:radical SAM protein [Chloroflexota bacterium]